VPSKSKRKRSSKRSTSRTSAKRKTSKSAAKRSKRGGVASPGRPSAGISRIDQPSRRTHGYFVRVGYRMTSNGSRPSASAYFGDASHGSRKKAWQAAEAWLKKTRKSL
jgi:hypothetical protein